MQSTIAPHLKTTYELLQRAFPKGIQSEWYYPLLAILTEEMSDRNLAEVIAYYTQTPYSQVLNDIYEVQSIHVPSQDEIRVVQNCLLKANYQQWLEEDS